MIMSPIIPVWLMAVICLCLLIIFRSKNKFEFLRQMIIVVLLFAINLRIMIESPNAKAQIRNLDLDVIFVIDNTVSMIAEDYNGKTPRMTAVKADCGHIIEKLIGAKFSIITFSNNSKVVIPFSQDTDLAKEAVETISIPNYYYASGSSLDLPLEDLMNELETSNKNDDRKRIVFYVSDGEIAGDNENIKSFKKCSKYVDDGAVLGYGSTEGGKMTVEDYDGNNTYLQYYDEESYERKTAVSKIDEKNLKKIADDLGVDYIKMDKQKNIDKKLESILKDAKKNVSESDRTLYNDIYYIFVIPLIIVLGWEYINYRRKL